MPGPAGSTNGAWGPSFASAADGGEFPAISSSDSVQLLQFELAADRAEFLDGGLPQAGFFDFWNDRTWHDGKGGLSLSQQVGLHDYMNQTFPPASLAGMSFPPDGGILPLTCRLASDCPPEYPSCGGGVCH